MLGRLRALMRRESGDILIVAAVLMTVMLGMGALAVDMGRVYVQGAKAQTAADAAVMAAGRMLPVSVSDDEKTAEILAAAAEYLQKNGYDNAEDFEIYLDTQDGVKYDTLGVRLRDSVHADFAKIFGTSLLSFDKTAEVKTMVCVRLADVVPLSVQAQKLSDCLAAGIRNDITLKYGTTDDTLPSGSFGAIDLDGVNGGGANDYSNWLANGYSGELNIGDTLPVESGNMVGPTDRALRTRYGQCTHFQSDGGCNSEHYEASCPRVIKVPVIEYTAKKRVQVMGFAAFVIDRPVDGVSGEVTGSYVDMVTIGSYGGDTTGTAEDFGVYSLMLSK